jgi:isoquinoline 1-oxidoreductase beta subunit
MAEPHPTLIDDQQESSTSSPSVTRRSLLGYAASTPVVAAGLAVAPSAAQALPLPLTPPDSVDYYDVGDSLVQLGALTMPLVKLDIDADGVYTMALPRLESGTGVATALAMMIADVANVPLSKVRVTSADAQPELVYNQITGGSCTIRAFEPVLPAMVAAAQLKAGIVQVPGQPTNPVVGQRVGKLDARDIVTGKKKFTMDLDVPGAKPTMCRMPSTVRGSVQSVNNRAAVLAMPGVLAVETIPGGGTIVGIPPGVAVMAETFGQAYDACRALDITWGPGTVAGESNATIFDKLRQAIPPQLPGAPLTITIDAEFTWKGASAAPLEVECAIVDATKPDRAEIWAGLQSPIVTAQAVALDLGLLPTQVVCHVIPSGGAFGRRLFWDPVQVAAQVSKKTGFVCKLMYHRSDDIRHTRQRPPQVHKVRASLLPNTLLTPGSVVSYQQSIGIVRLDARHGYGEIGTAMGGSLPPLVVQTVGNMGYEQFFFKTMVTSPYNYGTSTKLLFPVAIELNTVSYRSVHIQPARTVEEIITDEIAKALGKDPLAFRMEFLRTDRAKACLQRVKQVAQWGKAMPAGFAQGVAVHMESRSFSAAIAEVDARDPNNVKVTKVVMAIDVGRCINPSGVEQQCHGGIAEAISLVLKTGLNFENGLPREASYNQYTFCRMRDFPKDVQIIVMPNTTNAPAAGMGEVGMSAPSGAIANAYAKATGRKPRNFPLNAQPVFTATPAGQLPPPAVA